MRDAGRRFQQLRRATRGAPAQFARLPMLWMGIALALVASVLIVAAVVARRSAADLGSVSNHWVAQHRADAP
jgi:cell division protein FtsX